MLAVPRQQVRHLVGRRDPDVERVDGGLLRQSPLPYQRLRKPSCRVREREDGNASQRSQSTRSQELIASCGLVENEL